MSQNHPVNMKSILIFTLFLFVASSGAGAQNDIKKSIARCAVLKGDLERLECFDKLSRELKLTPQKKSFSNKGAGKWKIDTETNPVDDTKTIILSLEADKGKSKWLRPVYFMIRCKSNLLESYVTWDEYLGDDTSVLTRIGKAEATYPQWGISSDHTATFYRENIYDFIDSLVKEDTLVLQVTPYSESPRTAVFDIGGLNKNIQPLLETCPLNKAESEEVELLSRKP